MYRIKIPCGKVVDVKGTDNKNENYSDSSSESTTEIRKPAYVGNEKSEKIVKEITMIDTDSSDSSSESTTEIGKPTYVGNEESEEIVKEVTMSDIDSSNRFFMTNFLI